LDPLRIEHIPPLLPRLEHNPMPPVAKSSRQRDRRERMARIAKGSDQNTQLPPAHPVASIEWLLIAANTAAFRNHSGRRPVPSILVRCNISFRSSAGTLEQNALPLHLLR
ncbi:MAG: hypothetical protein M3355_09545, partial [Actinomycetota bacterium]|nr:hypothetical protein [Actinomycetota bacterium]